MNLPNLLVIGAMKSGTTSLHYYLGLHPQVFMSRRKELDFFVLDRNWAKGVSWYTSQFPVDAQVRGETSPRYALYPVHAGVPQRIHKLTPEIKLLYLVRDPVERLISHYMHDVIEGSEDRPLEQILNEEPENHYVLASRYWLQLQAYQPYFSTDQIMIIQQEDLLAQRKATLQAVFQFIGVDTGFESSRIAIERHRTNRKRRLTAAGKAVRGGVLKNIMAKLPAPARGYVEWIVLYPFSRAVPRYTPTRQFRGELEMHFKDEMAKVFETFQVARPDGCGPTMPRDGGR